MLTGVLGGDAVTVDKLNQQLELRKLELQMLKEVGADLEVIKQKTTEFIEFLQASKVK